MGQVSPVGPFFASFSTTFDLHSRCSPLFLCHENTGISHCALNQRLMSLGDQKVVIVECIPTAYMRCPHGIAQGRLQRVQLMPTFCSNAFEPRQAAFFSHLFLFVMFGKGCKGQT